MGRRLIGYFLSNVAVKFYDREGEGDE